MQVVWRFALCLAACGGGRAQPPGPAPGAFDRIGARAVESDSGVVARERAFRDDGGRVIAGVAVRHRAGVLHEITTDNREGQSHELARWLFFDGALVGVITVSTANATRDQCEITERDESRIYLDGEYVVATYFAQDKTRRCVGREPEPARSGPGWNCTGRHDPAMTNKLRKRARRLAELARSNQSLDGFCDGANEWSVLC